MGGLAPKKQSIYNCGHHSCRLYKVSRRAAATHNSVFFKARHCLDLGSELVLTALSLACDLATMLVAAAVLM